MITVDAATRLLSKLTAPASYDGCWEFTGYIKPNGYGSFWYLGANSYAHIAAYELFNGKPVPANCDVHHTCSNRKCCNPDHLRAVRHRTNIRESTSPMGLNAQKTHCLNGHRFSPSNLMNSADGKRRCKACNRERRRAA